MRHRSETGGSFVLYWMIAARRPAFNFALDRAVAWARRAGAAAGHPRAAAGRLSVCVGPAASLRHRRHGEQRRAFSRSPVLYYPYVEPRRGHGKGLLERLARDAAVVVTDDYPCFFLPRMVAAAGARLPVLLEAVDSNGVLPLAGTDRTFTAAAHFRRHMQKQLRDALLTFPSERPFCGKRLPQLAALPAGGDEALARGVGGAACRRPAARSRRCRSITRSASSRRAAGAAAAGGSLRAFVSRRLDDITSPTTTRTRAAPAGCRPTCTSGTSRRTRSSMR